MHSWPLDPEDGNATIQWSQYGRKLAFVSCTRQHTQMPDVLATDKGRTCSHLYHFLGKDHLWVKFFRKFHVSWHEPEISNATYIKERQPRRTVSMCCVYWQEAHWGLAQKQMKWLCKCPVMSVKAGETRKSMSFPCPTHLPVSSCTHLLCSQYLLHLQCAESLQNQPLALNTRERTSPGCRAYCLEHSNQMFSPPSWCLSLSLFS
jgi:hypothetical protein